MVSSDGMMLRGFVGDYRGAKNGLTFFRPVVGIDGEDFIALADRWTEADLRKANPDDNGFIRPTPAVPIETGDLVWLVGQIFVNRCIDVEGYGNRLKVWMPFNSEYRFAVGPLERFLELNRQIYAAAIRLMHASLFSVTDFAKAQRVFEVLNNIHHVEPAEQQIQRGLFYWEARQLDRYEMVRFDAVVDGTVDGADDFDDRVRELQQSLRSKRLRELPRPVTGATASVQLATDDLRALSERIRRLFVESAVHRLGDSSGLGIDLGDIVEAKVVK